MKITTILVEIFPVFILNLLQYIENQIFISLDWIQVGQPKKKEATTQVVVFLCLRSSE